MNRSNLPLAPSYTSNPPLLDPNVIDDPSDDEVLSWTPEQPTENSLTSLSGKPGGLLATASPPSQVELAWSDNSSDEAGFIIQRNVNRAGWEEYASVDANATAFVDTAVEPAIRHCYRVMAFNETESSAASTQVCLTLPTEAELTDPEDPVSPEEGSDELAPAEDGATKPDAKPTAVKVALLPDGQVQVTWTCTATNEDGFDVSRYNSKTKWIDAGSTAADATEFIDTTAEAGSSYCYRIRAYNVAGATSYSTTKCVSIPSHAPDPEEPVDAPPDEPPLEDPYGSLPGGIFYVGPEGTAENDGSLERPYASIMEALAHAGGGTMIVLKPGTYPGGTEIPPQYAGTRERPTIIRAQIQWAAIIDGSPAPLLHGITTVPGCSWIVFDGLQIRNAQGSGIKINGDYSTIRKCWILNNMYNGVEAHSRTGFVLEDSVIELNGLNHASNQRPHGVYAGGTGHIYRRNLVRNNFSHGLHLYPRITGSLVAGNLCYGNASRQIILAVPVDQPDAAPNEILHNTLVGGNCGLGLFGGPSQQPHLVMNNIFWGNSVTPVGFMSGNPTGLVDYNLMDRLPPAYTDYGTVPPSMLGAANRLAQNPGFAHAAAGKYWLTAESPARGMGQDRGSSLGPLTDFLGQPFGPGLRDVGAYQFDAALTAGSP
ncbi:MAG: hypothetical protein AMXMBFR13_32610 [Phycisphaerae bacterium]